MKSVIVFLAGAMFVSTTFAGDPGFAARFKMKTGRDLPTTEAKRNASPAKDKAVMSCDKHGCCSRTGETLANSTPSLGDPGAEARFRMKFGRPSPAEEARIAAAQPKAEAVASAHVCDGDCCKHHS
jgi:hypothetical protein